MLAYKYRGGEHQVLERDIHALKDDYFWASEVGDLNDPCENFIDSESVKDQLAGVIELLGSDPETKNRYDIFCNSLDELLFRKIGIFSLSKTYNDELLWAHYANSHKGFCIEYDLDVLTKNQSIRKYYSYEVEYVDIPPNVTIEDLNTLNRDLSKSKLLAKCTSTKSKRWSNEEEVRIIADNYGKQSYDFRAVKSIYFGVRMDDSYKEMIMAALRGRKVKYFQMNLKEKSYKFYRTQVPDKYSDSEPYLYSISPVADRAVQEEAVALEFKSYIPLLYKGVEIVRRDPYCKHVYYADFSLSKSSPDKPVIMVNCEKSNDDYNNVFYTADEIERVYSEITDL